MLYIFKKYLKKILYILFKIKIYFNKKNSFYMLFSLNK